MVLFLNALPLMRRPHSEQNQHSLPVSGIGFS